MAAMAAGDPSPLSSRSSAAMAAGDCRLRLGSYLGDVSALSFLPFSPRPLLLAGTGSELLVASFRVFDGVRVHGIQPRVNGPSGSPAADGLTVVVFGETRVKLLSLLVDAGGIELLSRLNHCHVVPLLGYCSERQGRQRLLVFECMTNGNLRECLKDLNMKPMDWVTRVGVALGAARGLEYLQPVVVPLFCRL